MHQGDIPLRFFLKCRFGLYGLEALFGLLDGRSDDARRHGVIDGYTLKPVSAATLLEEIRACRRSEKQK